MAQKRQPTEGNSHGIGLALYVASSSNACNVNNNGNANNNTASNANYVAAIMPFTKKNAYSKEAHIRVPEVIIEET